MPCLCAPEAGAQQAEDGWDQQLHGRNLLGASLHGGVGTGEFIGRDGGWESLGSVNKAPRECSLLLCTALLTACLHWGGSWCALPGGLHGLWKPEDAKEGKGGRAAEIPQGDGCLEEGPGNAARRVLKRERGVRRSDGLEGEEISQGLSQNLRWNSPRVLHPVEVLTCFFLAFLFSSPSH